MPDESPEAIAKAGVEYNPFKARRDPRYVSPYAGKGLSLWSEEEDVSGQPEVFRKPKGALVSFECPGLECNTLYEFRVSCSNAVGLSEFSIPSVRAKTKKDSAPGAGRPPILQDVSSAYVTLELDVPPAGGGPIEAFLIDIHDLEKDIIQTRQLKFENGNSIFKLTGLRVGGLLQFRSRAVNRIGEGPSSSWTGELRLPQLENEDFVSRASFRAGGGSKISSNESINIPPRSTKN